MSEVTSHHSNAIHDRFWASATLLGDTLAAFTLLAFFLRKRSDIVWTLFLTALFTTAWVHGLKNASDTLRPLATLGADTVQRAVDGFFRGRPDAAQAAAWVTAILSLDSTNPQQPAT